ATRRRASSRLSRPSSAVTRSDLHFLPSPLGGEGGRRGRRRIMSTTVQESPPQPQPAPVPQPRVHYLNVHFGVKSWLLTLDHKRIALLYLVSITAMFFVGGAYALMIRLELLTPGADLASSSDRYNTWFTLHGVIMIFFFLIP